MKITILFILFFAVVLPVDSFSFGQFRRQSKKLQLKPFFKLKTNTGLSTGGTGE